MRDIYRNPMTYYLIAPILVGLWPLLVLTIYLPAARGNMKAERDQCVEGTTYMLDILKYDPGRLEFSPDPNVSGEFSYAKAIDRAANLCGIRSTSYGYSAGPIIVSADKKNKTQNAKVSLKAVNIVQAASFLWQIQSMWVGLKCDQIILTKKEGVPDQWDVEMKFWYTY
jgi:hypothetical protein